MQLEKKNLFYNQNDDCSIARSELIEVEFIVKNSISADFPRRRSPRPRGVFSATFFSANTLRKYAGVIKGIPTKWHNFTITSVRLAEETYPMRIPTLLFVVALLLAAAYTPLHSQVIRVIWSVARSTNLDATRIKLTEPTASCMSINQSNLTEPDGSNTRKMLISFFVSGNSDRQEIVRLNLVHLRKSLTNWHADCLVLYFAPYASASPWLKTQPSEFRCEVIFEFRQHIPALMKLMNPWMMRSNRYELITIFLDDVIAYPPRSTFDPATYFDLMLQTRLSVATPNIIGTFSLCLQPQQPGPNSVGRIVKYIELQMTTFTEEAWACMYELADSEYPSGWGMDLWFYDYCIGAKRIHGTRMGVLDVFTIVHTQMPTVVEERNPLRVMEAQVSGWRTSRNITLTSQTGNSLSYCLEPIDRYSRLSTAPANCNYTSGPANGQTT